jgi:hypothetical protein
MLAVSEHTDGMPQTSGMTQVTAREMHVSELAIEPSMQGSAHERTPTTHGELNVSELAIEPSIQGSAHERTPTTHGELT